MVVLQSEALAIDSAYSRFSLPGVNTRGVHQRWLLHWKMAPAWAAWVVRCLICALILVGRVLVCNGYAEPMVVVHEFQQRIERAIEKLRQLDALEIEAVDELHADMGELGLPEFGRRTWLKFLKSGSKYRVECTNEPVRSPPANTSNTNLVQKVVVTYDGATWSTYVDDYRYLVLGRTNPPGDPSPCPLNPVLAPFVFLSKESDECKPCRIWWDDVASGNALTNLSYKGSILSNGLLEVTFAGLQLEGKTQYWSIVLDAQGTGFEPRLIKRVIADTAIMEFVFESYTNVTIWSDNQRPVLITIPLAFSYSGVELAGGKPVPVLRGRTELVSVRVPKDLPATLFQVEDANALFVWDRDQNKLVKTAGPYALVQKKISRVRLAVLVTMVLVSLGMLLWLFQMLRMAKRNPGKEYSQRST